MYFKNSLNNSIQIKYLKISYIMNGQIKLNLTFVKTVNRD